MKKIFNLFAAALMLSLIACQSQNSISASQLREQDDHLSARANELFLQKNKLPQNEYLKRLETLRSEEMQLLENAKQCQFGDNVKEKNYWQLSRLKFPGKIQLELEKMKA